jgi:hypothetical protein
MQITPKTMKSVPFSIGPLGIQVVHNAGAHFAHNGADRVTKTIAKNQNNNVYQIQMQNSPTGDTVFLPYRPNEVHSIELPGNPGAGGPTCFLTANLDGCCMFVEVKTNGNVVVYHANASTGVTPTIQQSATQPTYQTQGCLAQLANLYTTASGYYAGTPNQGQAVALKKATYLKQVDTILAHKNQQGRTGVQFGGGVEHASLTTFAGFFIKGHWEFWYQTYSQFIYDRPATHWKAKLGYSRINPHVTQDDYQVTDCRLYFKA